MCGIAAITGDSIGDAEERLVWEMLEVMAGRGDQSPNVSRFAHAALGCNRLAIVDREHGAQPFTDARTGSTIVYNGEIYNVTNVVAQLAAAGSTVNTACDTEAVLAACQAWGAPAAVDALDGMYAFVIVDTLGYVVAVARDPHGIKPLYEGRHGTHRVLASEAKALVAIGASDVAPVAPGSVNATEIELPHVTTSIRSDREILASTRTAISEAVASMVRTDLPVAVLCSGGIDSGVVLYEASQSHRDVTVFTIGVSEDAADVVAASRLARYLNVPFRYVHCSPQELLSAIRTVIYCIESFEPNHIRGGTLSYVLAREVHRAGFRVALCGEGADELFCGYPEFLLSLSKPCMEQELRGLVRRFVEELPRTQLQRVDRTSMHWQLEVRVPYLARDVVTLALGLPAHTKLRRTPEGRIVNKWALREAYRGILPDWLIDRPKQVLSDGAGVGDNSAGGLFFDHARRVATAQQLEAITAFPQYQLATVEEAYYFSIFREFFGDLRHAALRPHVNTLPTI